MPQYVFELALLLVRVLYEEESRYMPQYVFELALLLVRVLLFEDE